MQTLVLLALAALVLWGVLASILALDNDGYGRPEIRDRTRHIERRPTIDAR
ncbi:hypothetical protein WDJ51_02105 [Rathayibacter sp. YIM 133350]|uniref:hypothetical protein n=1 Tax=Rathayibacter sp. YIM 133350 TaxID=3131992 RepID=UPI00307CFB35